MEEKQTECKKSYYAVIPATVRYDKKIMTGAKLLYGEITALCNEKGYCWATNEYFANLYGVSKRTIINWINSLSDAGYIEIEIKYKEGTKQIDKRKIFLPDTSIKKKEVKCAEPQERDSTPPSEENFTTPDVSDFTTPSEKNFTTPMKEISHPSEEIFTTPSEKNFTENITYKNNTNNNKINILFDDDIAHVRKKIKEQIEYSHFEKFFSSASLAYIDTIVELMLEVYLADSKKNSEIYGVNTILFKERITKIDSDHIEYMLEKLKTAENIGNIKAYFAKTLFNAPSTIDVHYAREVEDMLHSP